MIAQGASKIDFGKETLKRMQKVGHYNSWMVDLIVPFLGKEIVEIGCGIGSFTEFFINNSLRYAAIDVREDYVAAVKERFGHIAGFEAHLCDVTKSDYSKLKGFDTVVCLNVLEHIEHHEKALEAFYSMLAPKGRLLLQVPAHQALYSQLDSNIYHYRRYSKHDLGSLLEKRGFRIVKLYYTNMAGAVGWFVTGKILRRQILPESGLSVFNVIAPILQKVETIVDLPFGLSVMAVAERVS
jgi:SAM-dependent methyltransferase